MTHSEILNAELSVNDRKYIEITGDKVDETGVLPVMKMNAKHQS